MDASERFWISVWTLVAATIIAFAALIGFFDALGNIHVRKMVEAGADPIEARCAIYHDSYNGCLVYGVKND